MWDLVYISSNSQTTYLFACFVSKARGNQRRKVVMKGPSADTLLGIAYDHTRLLASVP